MRKLVIFVFGCLAGMVFSLLLLFLTSMVLTYFDIQLYGSEGDQQRNFTVFLSISSVLAVIGGLLALFKYARPAKKNIHPNTL